MYSRVPPEPAPVPCPDLNGGGFLSRVGPTTALTSDGLDHLLATGPMSNNHIFATNVTVINNTAGTSDSTCGATMTMLVCSFRDCTTERNCFALLCIHQVKPLFFCVTQASLVPASTRSVRVLCVTCVRTHTESHVLRHTVLLVYYSVLMAACVFVVQTILKYGEHPVEDCSIEASDISATGNRAGDRGTRSQLFHQGEATVTVRSLTAGFWLLCCRLCMSFFLLGCSGVGRRILSICRKLQ